VLIANLVGAPAGLHAEAANSAGGVSGQVLSGAGRTQQPQRSSGATGETNPEGSQSDAPRVQTQGRATIGLSSRAARRETRRTQTPADVESNGSPFIVTNQAAEPAPFLDILGDILPKGSLPQDPPSQGLQFSGTTLNPGNPVATGSVLNQVKSEANAATLTAETNTPGTGGSQAGNNAAPNAVQQVVAGTRDALWDRAVSEGETEPQRNAGEPVEVAFAARIAARTPEPQVIAPNEAQAAIAASRFAGLDAAAAPPALPEEPVMATASGFEGTDSDGSSSEPQSDTGLNASAGTGPTRVPSAGSGENGTATQTMAPDAQATAQPQASAAVVPLSAAGRVLSIQATSGTMGARSAGTGQQGSNPGAGSNLFAMAAPANAGVSAGKGATDPKPAPEERAAPPFEAPNDAAERSGEMVRAISLNLSSQDQSVQVRLSERAGELHVTVRTPDAGLTHGLREGLSDLVGRLEHGGYRAEAWRPGGNDSSDRGQDSPSRRGSSQQQNDGSKGSGQQENSQDSESDAQTPQWMGELESSIQRSNSVWPASAIR